MTKCIPSTRMKPPRRGIAVMWSHQRGIHHHSGCFVSDHNYIDRSLAKCVRPWPSMAFQQPRCFRTVFLDVKFVLCLASSQRCVRLCICNCSQRLQLSLWEVSTHSPPPPVQNEYALLLHARHTKLVRHLACSSLA